MPLRNDFITAPSLDMWPLSENERALIRSTELHAWTPLHHEALVRALRVRGLAPWPYATVASMAEALEEIAQ